MLIDGDEDEGRDGWVGEGEKDGDVNGISSCFDGETGLAMVVRVEGDLVAGGSKRWEVGDGASRSRCS